MRARRPAAVRGATGCVSLPGWPPTRSRASAAASAFCASSSSASSRNADPRRWLKSEPRPRARAHRPARERRCAGTPGSRCRPPRAPAASVSSFFATRSFTSGDSFAISAAFSCDSARLRAFSSSDAAAGRSTTAVAASGAVAPLSPGDSVAEVIGPGGCSGSASGWWPLAVAVALRVCQRVDGADLEGVEVRGVLRRALVGLAVEGQHLVRAREADAPPVVLDALARDVDEAEARPLDRFLDHIAHVQLVVDRRLRVQRVRAGAHQALEVDRRVRISAGGLDSVFVPVGVVGPVCPPVSP